MTSPDAKIIPDKFRYLPPDSELVNWIAAGKDVPDLDSLPSCANLPDPLQFAKPAARKAEDWPRQREAILAAYQKYSIGTCPPAPGNVEARVLLEQAEDRDARRQEVELSFGPDRRAKLHMELLLPPGSGPFPVFMTQRNHAGWARMALARGFAAVSVNACDGLDDSQAFREIWPEHDWSMLCRRAWAMGRALDWLHTLDCIDRRHACITGHSRNGKLSLIAGAIDERFDVVISSSSGLGGATPYRMANDAHFSEGIDVVCTAYPQWFHPRLHFFSGREDRLPIDSNLLVALSAPRAVLISSAIHDVCESASAMEVMMRSAMRVWKLLGCEEKAALLYRWGWHDSRTDTIERYLDWCELHWGRAAESPARAVKAGGSFARTWFFPYKFASWKKTGGEKIDPRAMPALPALIESLPKATQEWEARRADRLARMNWLLGEAPPSAKRANHRYGVEEPYIQEMFNRFDHDTLRGLETQQTTFGEYIPATIYAPAGTATRVEQGGAKIPMAIWLHPESRPCGFSGGYVFGDQAPAPLAKAGFGVLGYDQIGNGRRLEEATRFYDRFPRWSLLGKMVHDALRAIDAALQIPFADPKRLFLYGFGIGATVALLAAAMDERVAGVASFSGFTPMRKDTSNRSSGGIARYALWDAGGLIPRLGFFAASRPLQRRIPIDFDEILASIAPRHLMIVSPLVDREASHADIELTMRAVKSVYELYGAGEKLWQHSPYDHKRFAAEQQAQMYQAMLRAAGINKTA